MAKLIVKSPYIQCGGGGKPSGFMHYIATRDGVELLPVSGYMAYMGTRPGAEKLGDHGLFGDDDAVDLSQRMTEIDSYTGNVWTHIFSLKREDASRLGYDNAKTWQDLLRTHRNDIATAMHIPLKNFRWCAAYHDEGEHPHVHMMAWSVDPTEGHLERDGIRKIRSELTNDIFNQEMLHLYEQKNESRNDLVREARKAVLDLSKSLKSSLITTPQLELLMMDLAVAMEPTKGKKSYGYLPKPQKKLVDSMVDQLAQHPAVAECYEKWQALQTEIEGYYHGRAYECKPLSQEKAFHAIKNAIIKEAETLRLKEISFEEMRMINQSDYPPPNQYYETLLNNMYQRRYTPEGKEQAILELQELGESGNTWAQFQLGLLYKEGDLVLQDSELAVRWFTLASEGGSHMAQCLLGELHLWDDDALRNEELCSKWWKESFDQGNGHAGYNLGVAYHNRPEGVTYLQQAVKMGSPNAQYLLAKLYLMGRETPPHDKAAAQLLEQAMEQGHPYAHLLLERSQTSPMPTACLGVIRLFHHMGNIFRDNTLLPKNPGTIDRKRFAKLMEKRRAQGMKDVPTQGYGMGMMGY